MANRNKNDDVWRQRGEAYYEVANELAAASQDPAHHALLGIYCELRHMSGSGEQVEAMRRLAHALSVYGATVQEYGTR